MFCAASIFFSAALVMIRSQQRINLP